MTNSVTYQVNLQVVGDNIIGQVTAEIDKMTRSTEKATKTFGDCFKSLWSFRLVADEINNVKQSFDSLIEPGALLNSNMAELSAITGVTGEGLKAIEQAARDTSKTFGTDASANVEAYKMMLSQLSPEIAQNSEAMKMMGDNANILSKQMGGDTVAATEVLNTSLNQFSVSMDDPIAAAKVMADMMNVMSAAAQEGSAELPQIKSALEQVGMVAKTTGLSFAETNAYIQLLDKSGKKGSEGGVALRNVLTTLSEGRFTSKLAAQGLQQAGISVNYLADSSIPLHERLRSLRTIQGDTALMTKVFGKENMAAAIAMINSADEAEALTSKIVGTNSATEQAQIIMGSYNEKMARTKAWWDDLKISFFNYIEGYASLIQNSFTVISALGQLSVVGNALITTLRVLSIQKTINTAKLWLNTIATKANAVAKWAASKATKVWRGDLISINAQMGIGAIISRIQAGGIRSVAVAFGQATMGATAFQIALDALGIGLIILAITGLIAGLKYLWNHSRRFREILFGIGYAGKAVFHNIGVVVGRVWNLVIKPIAMAYWSVYKWVFTNIWNVVKAIIEGIGSYFSWLWNEVISPIATWIWETLSSVFMSVYNTVVSVFTTIGEFASAVWNWLVELLGGFGEWINQVIIEPIYQAFSKIWDWIIQLIDKIMNKLSGLFKPIVELWNKLFSSDGMVSISAAGAKGVEVGGLSFDKDQKEKQNGDEPQEVKVVEDDHRSIFDVATGNGVTTPTIGGVAAEKANKKEVGGKTESGNKERNLTVGKFMDNFNVYMNNSNGVDKNQLLQAVREVLLTASADFVATE
ncbi:phage tail tape measure protein [Flavobacteriaceae bacterium Ap0902]|nr:phage tail tape measure protein [Flavobacteriaceae bacterium Ap0902]